MAAAADRRRRWIPFPGTAARWSRPPATSPATRPATPTTTAATGPRPTAGTGTRRRCSRAATRVLALGDEAYGTPNAFETSYAPTWGVYKSITHPITGDHEYDDAPARTTSHGTRRTSAPRPGAPGKLLLLLRRRLVAHRRPELELRAGGVRRAVAEVGLAPGRPGGQGRAVHAGLLAPPALHRWAARARRRGLDAAVLARGRRGQRRHRSCTATTTTTSAGRR